MAHYAKVVDGKVVKVIVAEAEFFDTFIDDSPGAWIQTSYNTYGNEHKLGGTPLRGNYAGTGSIYDAENDVFYAPQPYPSWTLNTSTWLWEPPVAKPEIDEPHVWDEATTSWVSVVDPSAPVPPLTAEQVAIIEAAGGVNTLPVAGE